MNPNNVARNRTARLASERPRPVWTSRSRGVTTGTRECRECDAAAYSHHKPFCSKAD